MGIYRVAQVCLRGHCISDSIDVNPELASDYCPECGSKTITCCPTCHASIRGFYDVPGVIILGSNYKPPRYCHNCGKPYPWIQAAFDELDELAKDDGSITSMEAEKLRRILPDIISETPKSRSATSFFVSVCQKAGVMLRDSMLDFAAKFATEMVKSYLPK